MKNLNMFLALLSAITICFCLAWYNEHTAQFEIYEKTIQRSSESSTVQISNSTYEPNTAISIMLDAGHGGYDSGSIALDGTLEKDITLSLTMKIGAYLEEAGYIVLYTRESDEVSWDSNNLTDLQARVTMAYNQNADYYISIHTNFSSYNDGAYGFETYLNYQDASIIAMAEEIHANLSALQFSSDRGLKSTAESSLYVIDHNSVPAMLLEVGFLSDSDDAKYLIYHQDALAQAIANGIVASL